MVAFNDRRPPAGRLAASREAKQHVQELASSLHHKMVWTQVGGPKQGAAYQHQGVCKDCGAAASAGAGWSSVHLPFAPDARSTACPVNDPSRPAEERAFAKEHGATLSAMDAQVKHEQFATALGRYRREVGL